MRRTLETIFRHPLQILILIVLLPIVGVAVAYFMVPRSYQSTASVWAFQRYFVIGATGQESDLNSTPAQTQTTALGELLQTRRFDSEVVQGIDLAPTLGLNASATNNSQLQEALFNEISKHVLVTPSAYSLFDISYTNQSPLVAQQIVQSVITNYGKQSLALTSAEGQNLLATYQTQLVNAQNNLNSAVLAETQYVRTRPSQTLDLLKDPQYTLLDAQRVQAQTNVQNIQTAINALKQSISSVGTNGNTLYQVIDTPQVIPVSRTKNYLIAGGTGLGLALVACVMYLVITVRRDRGIYSSEDLQDLVAFPIVMQLPKLTPAAVSLLTAKTVNSRGLLMDRQNSSHDHSR